MRRMRSYLSPLAAAAFALAAHPAAAQQFTVASARPSTLASATDERLVRTIAIYSFEGARDPSMPSAVTIVDSAGTIIGTYRVRGNSDERVMNAEVEGMDLRLEAATPSGELTIVIYEIGERPRSTTVVGRWMLGNKQGELVRRSR